MFRLFIASARVARYRFAAVVLLTILIAGWGAASAAGTNAAPQASPAAPAPDVSPVSSAAPDASPAGTQRVGPNAAPPRTVSPPSTTAKFGHLPIIDIIPIYTYPQAYTLTPRKPNPLLAGNVGYDPLDVGGTIRIPITPAISASFDRLVEGTLNVPDARVTTATGAYQYPLYSRDSVLVYRLDEQFHRFQIEQGLYFRHRIVGGAANGTSTSQTSNNPLLPTIASREAHFGYVGITYASPGISWLAHSFISLNINADTQAIDHHVACLLNAIGSIAKTCPAGNTTGVIDENRSQDRVWETDQYVQLTVPVDRKHGVTVVAQDRWGALNFYENAPFPTRWVTSQTYIVTKRFNRVFALSVRARDQWAVPSGYPYVKPNAQHNGTIDVLADFKIDTNNLH